MSTCKMLVALAVWCSVLASLSQCSAVQESEALVEWYTNLWGILNQHQISGDAPQPFQQLQLQQPQPSANTPYAIPTIKTTTPPHLDNTPSDQSSVTKGGVGGGAGVITTPDYPDQYDHDLYCTWVIVGGKGKRVRLSFDDFEVTQTPECTGDFLLVSEKGSANDSNAAPLCGTDTPGEFVSEADVIYVEFRSTPDGDTCRGFSARYSIEEVVVTCGDEVSFLEFDFQNPEYPEATRNDTSHCQLTISHECDVPICQVRLDLEEFELQPPEYGNCDSDQFIVRANEPVPVLCGTNHGQHMYVEVGGRASTSLHFLLSPILPKPVGHITDPVTGDTEPADGMPTVPRGGEGECKQLQLRRVKLNYDPCWNGTEDACGKRVWTGHLNSLDYQCVCEAMEGYCGIMYSPTGPESFLLTGQTDANITTLKEKTCTGRKGCQSDYVMVAKSRTPGDNGPLSHDRFCGSALGNYVQGPIVSYSTPFYMQVKTDADEFSRSVDLGNRGFQLEYTQLPCSGPYLFNSDQKYSG
ncbi:hypothetical protein Pcinc_037933 [Petrolisthes cinctipes]|uniref:CUB domain-containing protein n=1 Tax=Petrolisthes cinctipes TaxID=88211 RepID=A0AAE1BRM9_PETCI|nr:hypothetical protein Pcinc_037933 [Petrolisthes cinctipes]